MASEFNCTNVAVSFDFSQGILRNTPALTSRKAKDYTYLYGSSLDDAESSLTRHLNSAFADGCDEYFHPRSRLSLGLY